MSQQDVTLGEVYRLCQSIDGTVKAQNGRVRRLEKQVFVLWLAAGLMGAIAVAWAKQKLGL